VKKKQSDYISADDLDRAVGAFTILDCLCCDKDNASKRLELLPFRNHSHMTPTRRTLCLTQHLYPRALPAQHPQRPCPRLRQEGNFEEFFDTLTAHSNHPCHEPRIYAGDFNAYTAEEIESHITPLDSHALFHRVGDTNPAHSPAYPLTTATAPPAADFRGRLLLNMLNSIEFIITNRRFPSPSPNHRPYTFFQKPNTYSILDYIS